MPRRPEEIEPDNIRTKLVDLLQNFEARLKDADLRQRVLSLVPAFHLLRDLGSSLISREEASAGRDRILSYFRKYPFVVINGDELMVVSGIQDWPRRVRELRKEFGWSIASGVTLKEMSMAGEVIPEDVIVGALRPEQYILLSEKQDRDAAYRWRVANEIRREKLGVRDKILKLMRENVGKPLTGEELRYVANGKTEWARRVRELRTEHGWPVVTSNTGRPDLPLGTYLLEEDRQGPQHDRDIPDAVRRSVLVRDNHRCTHCGWTHDNWSPSDPRHLELHHIRHHAEGGENTEDNLTTLCSPCHDQIHRKEKI